MFIKWQILNNSNIISILFILRRCVYQLVRSGAEPHAMNGSPDRFVLQPNFSSKKDCFE